VVSVLLDTNALAEPIRPVPDPSFMKRFDAHAASLAISAVTLHEATFGIERLAEGKRRRVLSDYMRDVVARMPVLPYDAEAATWHARARFRLQRKGRLLPYADAQIAAIAAVHGLTLVTANARDFRGIDGLKVADWRS
jgi:tRNA(fMet)-specific endonuclease VapC